MENTPSIGGVLLLCHAFENNFCTVLGHQLEGKTLFSLE